MPTADGRAAHRRVLGGGGPVALDAVSLHPDWISSAERNALNARGVELTLWSRSLGPRQLRTLADLEPRFVSTSDAVRLRRWLGE